MKDEHTAFLLGQYPLRTFTRSDACSTANLKGFITLGVSSLTVVSAHAGRAEKCRLHICADIP